MEERRENDAISARAQEFLKTPVNEIIIELTIARSLTRAAYA
jgi:hypothetical protein